MAVTTLVLENNPSKNERQAILLNALRSHFNNPDIEITYEGKGKPKLININKFISVTCCGDYMICAISDTNIGIHAEHYSVFSADKKTDYSVLAERFFTEEESDYVREGDDTGARFTKIWVRKQAYVKFTGKGMADFPNFSVNDGERFHGKINGIPVKKYQVNFPGSNEYIFSIVGDYST